MYSVVGLFLSQKCIGIFSNFCVSDARLKYDHRCNLSSGCPLLPGELTAKLLLCKVFANLWAIIVCRRDLFCYHIFFRTSGFHTYFISVASQAQIAARRHWPMIENSKIVSS